MVCVVDEPLATLTGIPGLIARFDVGTAEEPELKAVLRDVRSVQRCLDGLVMRIAARSNALAATGRASPAAETMRDGGAVGSRQARREAARAEAAESIDGLGRAASNGDVSGEHVDSIARHSSRLSDEQRTMVDFESLVERAKGLPPETFDRLVKRTVDAALADHGLADTIAKQQASEFRHWFDHQSGMGRFAGALDPERYEVLVDAVDRHTSSLSGKSGVPKTKNLAAEALVDLVSGSGGGNGRRRSGGLPSVLVVVDHRTLEQGPHDRSIRQTGGGHDIASASVARLCCDAVLRRVVFGSSGVPLEVGRAHRTATDGQWAALKAMYPCCAWVGCTAPISWCQAHHIQEWERGGRTDLHNLVPLCSEHHHRVHEGQWHIKLRPDRALEIYRPNRRLHTVVPAPGRGGEIGRSSGADQLPDGDRPAGLRPRPGRREPGVVPRE